MRRFVHGRAGVVDVPETADALRGLEAVEGDPGLLQRPRRGQAGRTRADDRVPVLGHGRDAASEPTSSVSCAVMSSSEIVGVPSPACGP